MKQLGAVGKVGVALLLSTRVEVLIHTGCPIPVVGEPTVEVHVECVEPEVVAVPIHSALESSVTNTKLTFRIYGISNVAGCYGRLRG